MSKPKRIRKVIVKFLLGAFASYLLLMLICTVMCFVFDSMINSRFGPDSEFGFDLSEIPDDAWAIDKSSEQGKRLVYFVYPFLYQEDGQRFSGMSRDLRRGAYFPSYVSMPDKNQMKYLEYAEGLREHIQKAALSGEPTTAEYASLDLIKHCIISGKKIISASYTIMLAGIVDALNQNDQERAIAYFEAMAQLNILFKPLSDKTPVKPDYYFSLSLAFELILDSELQPDAIHARLKAAYKEVQGMSGVEWYTSSGFLFRELNNIPPKLPRFPGRSEKEISDYMNRHWVKKCKFYLFYPYWRMAQKRGWLITGGVLVEFLSNHSNGAELNRIDTELHQSGQYNFLSFILANSDGPWASRYYLNVYTRLKLELLSIYMREFNAKNGKYPDIKELAKYLQESGKGLDCADPYAPQKLLKIRATDKGVEIYSIGKNMVDDGGKLTDWYTKDRPDDIAFKIRR